MGHFLRLLIGLKPRQTLVLGRPVPPALQRWTPLVIRHDRRVSAGIFALKSKAKTADLVYRLAIWKAFQSPKSHEWIVSMSLFPDEIDPALRLLADCRRELPLKAEGA